MLRHCMFALCGRWDRQRSHRCCRARRTFCSDLHRRRQQACIPVSTRWPLPPPRRAYNVAGCVTVEIEDHFVNSPFNKSPERSVHVRSLKGPAPSYGFPLWLMVVVTAFGSSFTYCFILWVPEPILSPASPPAQLLHEFPLCLLVTGATIIMASVSYQP
jgi:hypothetical protein